MSLGVGSVALASVSSDMLRESLLDDMGMASVWSSVPPMEGLASSGDTSKPVSLSPKGQKTKLKTTSSIFCNVSFKFELCKLCDTTCSVFHTSSTGLDEEKFGFAL